MQDVLIKLQTKIENASLPTSNPEVFVRCLDLFASKNDGVSFKIGDSFSTAKDRDGNIQITFPENFTQKDLYQAAKIIRTRVDEKVINEIADKYVLVGKYLDQFSDDKRIQEFSKGIGTQLVNYGKLLGSELSSDTKLTREERNLAEREILGLKRYYKELEKSGSTEEISEDRRERLTKIFISGLTKSKNFQEKLVEHTESFLSLPEIALFTQIVERGKKEIRDNLKADIIPGGDPTVTLYEFMQIGKIKSIIDLVTNKDEWRLYVLNCVHVYLSQIAPDKEDVEDPIHFSITAKGIQERKMTYCQGFSLLGQAYLEELGIKYIPMNIHKHSTGIALIGEKIYLSDMQYEFPIEITDKFSDNEKKAIRELSYFDSLNISNLGRFKDLYPEIEGSLYAQIGISKKILSANLGTFGITAALDANNHLEESDQSSAEIKFMNAEEFYKMALKLDPNSVNTEFNLGSLYKRFGKNDLAINHFEKAIRKDPVYAIPEKALGSLYFTQSNWLKSKEHYERFVAKSLKVGVDANDERISEAKRMIAFCELGSKFKIS